MAWKPLEDFSKEEGCPDLGLTRLSLVAALSMAGGGASQTVTCARVPGDLLEMQILMRQVWGGAWDSASLTLMLLVCGPQFA